MQTCTECGCVIGDGGSIVHLAYHRRIDLLVEQVEIIMDYIEPEGSDVVPVETIDTKGRT